MWSSISHPALNGQNMGPNYMQKRHLTQPISSRPILPAPGKNFTNPNFVNKQFPVIHSYQNNFKNFDNSSRHISNSSHIIIDKIKEECPEIISNTGTKFETNIPEEKVTEDMCCTSNGNRRSRSNKRKMPGKSSKQHQLKNQIIDMMNVDNEVEVPVVCASDSDIRPKCYNLSDFIISKPSHKAITKKIEITPTTSVNFSINISPTFKNRPISHSESEDTFIIFENGTEGACEEEFDKSRLCNGRQRQPSMCESEDSFIVFEGNDDEDSYGSTEYSEDETEEEEEDLDSSCSVIENKRVRFADNTELCEVHPMIQWSYAYQAARKGPWEEYARDRERFNNRIKEVEGKLSPIFNPEYRNRVFRERFQQNL